MVYNTTCMRRKANIRVPLFKLNCTRVPGRQTAQSRVKRDTVLSSLHDSRFLHAKAFARAALSHFKNYDLIQINRSLVYSGSHLLDNIFTLPSPYEKNKKEGESKVDVPVIGKKVQACLEMTVNVFSDWILKKISTNIVKSLKLPRLEQRI